MHRSFAAALVLLTVGCSKPSPPGGDANDASARAASASAVPVTAESAVASASAAPAASLEPEPYSLKPGAECTRDFQCEQPDGCEVRCQKPYTDKHKVAGPSYCQLKTVSDKEGASPCVGEVIHVESSSLGTAKFPRAILCDAAAALFCDHTTHTCAKAKPVGAACAQGGTGVVDDNECGPDGVCHDGKCIAAGAPGASCKDHRCKVSAFCNAATHRCVARKPIGAKCKMSDECVSGSCLNQEKCVAKVSPKCTL